MAHISENDVNGKRVDYVLRKEQVTNLITNYNWVTSRNSCPVGGWHGNKYILGMILRRHGEFEDYINVEFECECYADGMAYLES